MSIWTQLFFLSVNEFNSPAANSVYISGLRHSTIADEAERCNGIGCTSAVRRAPMLSFDCLAEE